MNRVSSKIALTALFVALSFSSSALARDATPEEWRRVADHLRSLGYSGIQDVDVSGNRFEVDATSPQGRDVDVYLDRSTLRVLSERRS